MTAQRYERLSAPLRGRPGLVRALKRGNQLLTLICYIAYPLLLLLLLLRADPRLVRALLVPAVSFAGVTVFRRLCDSPRPYEKLDITPLIPRDKKGQSFPSRHVFSVFIIAMAWWFVRPTVGAALCAVGVLLALVRVVAGIHFPRDVIAGAAIGVAAGLFGFYLI